MLFFIDIFNKLLSVFYIIHIYSIGYIFTRLSYFCKDMAWVNKTVGAFCVFILTPTNPVKKTVVQLKTIIFLTSMFNNKAKKDFHCCTSRP